MHNLQYQQGIGQKQRTCFLTPRGGYHGDTTGAMSVCDPVTGMHCLFTHMLPRQIFMERPSCRFDQPFDPASLDDARRIFAEQGERIAAVILEPLVQGAGGMWFYHPDYLRGMARLCHEHGALLVFDEIQTGMGRTGQLFAMLKYGVTPDIVCLAKAFGGGMPLGAFVARREIMDTLQTDPVLGHITTFGGHPVCCAAGLAALNYLLDNKVVEQAEAKGALYETLLGSHPAVREIRRSGLLMAVELGESAKLYRTMELFKDAGILSDWFLFCDTAFRISPPLTISGEEVRESAALIRECLDRLR